MSITTQTKGGSQAFAAAAGSPLLLPIGKRLRNGWKIVGYAYDEEALYFVEHRDGFVGVMPRSVINAQEANDQGVPPKQAKPA